jgi:hypothetical protein
MIPVLVAAAFFAAYCIVGLAILTTLGADLQELRVVLGAPAVGTAALVLPMFFLSHLGAGMDKSGPLVIFPLLAVSAVVLIRRPRKVSAYAAIIVAICVANLLIVGRPLFEFGFGWIANANDDMANYVLSATDLLHHGLLASPDVAGLASDRDFPSALRGLHIIGARPGADLSLAGFSAATGWPPYELFMPLILSLNLATICATSALTMQAARKGWAAVLAAALVAASPLASLGVLQQLLPQVWGLGLAAAIFSLVMRPELYTSPGPSRKELVPLSLLVSALFVVYVELAASLTLAYGLYVVVLIARRRVEIRSSLLLWGSVLAVALAFLNTYLWTELRFAWAQTGHGTSTGGAVSPFAFAEVPATLPAIVGLLQLSTYHSPHIGTAIVLTLVALVAIGIAAVLGMLRGQGAATVLVADLALGVYLGVHDSAFGLFKLYMYVQPFIAAAVAVWISFLRPRALLLGAALMTLVLLGAQLRTQSRYVNASRDPIDLHDASSSSLLPVFRHALELYKAPVVSVTENPTLAKLEAAGIGTRPLHLISVDVFGNLVKGTFSAAGRVAGARDNAEYRRLGGWRTRWFELAPHASGGAARPATRKLSFEDNPQATRLLNTGKCLLAMPSGSETPFNREAYPEGSPDLLMKPCKEAKSLLVFTSSALGQSYYTFVDPRAISFHQLEPDSFFPSQTFSSFGRYALFRVLNPAPKFRLELNMTVTPIQAVTSLPPASAVGTSRVRFPTVGAGSARVLSPPIRPQVIGGQRFILLDLGRAGRLPSIPRPGVEGLYGRSVHLDPRYITAYLRDLSVVPAAEYGRLRPPTQIAHFPADLANPALMYSGIYEQGYVGDDSYATLAGGGDARLDIQGTALAASHPRRLEVKLNGRQILSKQIDPGPLNLEVPVPKSRSPRTVELIWNPETASTAGSPDLPAQLRYLGFRRS